MSDSWSIIMHSDLLRKIDLNDLNRIVELERKCFGEQLAYTPKQLKYLINKANSYCLAEVDNELIRGFIIILYKNGSGVAGIETLNVDPIFRGNGIGRKLLIAAEKEMFSRAIRRVRLEVSTGNTPAISLYEKSGFRKTSILKNYYKNQIFGNNDAFRMIKELTT
jgi:ribosomal-protein-alanine N-acetyltransferase